MATPTTKRYQGKIWALLLMAISMLAISLTLSGQEGQKKKEDLEKSKKALEKEIEYKRSLLYETQRNRKVSLGEVSILRDLISKRESLIATIDSEIRFLNRQIIINQENIKKLEREQVRLKEEYAKLVYFAYRNKSSYQRLMFIFAAEDFNQAYQRLKYMQHYSRYRKRQASNIREAREAKAREVTMMEDQKAEKEGLLLKQEGEKGILAQEKRAKDNTVTQLSRRESALRTEIRSKEVAALKLQKTIDKIIEEEIRKSTVATGTTAPNPRSFALTPAEQKLSVSFNDNKGKLPWPTERGHMSSSFGTQPHPDLPNVYTQNNGIDIITSSGSTARAVFSGTVTAVRSVPKYRNVVIVRHGEYLTVYTNLDEVTVVEGDKVSIKQVLGVIHTDPQSSRTELHFEVRKGFTLLDPKQWLAGEL